MSFSVSKAFINLFDDACPFCLKFDVYIAALLAAASVLNILSIFFKRQRRNGMSFSVSKGKNRQLMFVPSSALNGIHIFPRCSQLLPFSIS